MTQGIASLLCNSLAFYCIQTWM